MIGHLNSEMIRLIRKMMSKFVKSKVIRENEVTGVPYDNKENQLDDDVIAVGWRAREFVLESDTVSTEMRRKFFRYLYFYICVC